MIHDEWTRVERVDPSTQVDTFNQSFVEKIAPFSLVERVKSLSRVQKTNPTVSNCMPQLCRTVWSDRMRDVNAAEGRDAPSLTHPRPPSVASKPAGVYTCRDVVCAYLLPTVLVAVVIVAVSNVATYFSVSKVSLDTGRPAWSW